MEYLHYCQQYLHQLLAQTGTLQWPRAHKRLHNVELSAPRDPVDRRRSILVFDIHDLHCYKYDHTDRSMVSTPSQLARLWKGENTSLEISN